MSDETTPTETVEETPVAGTNPGQVPTPEVAPEASTEEVTPAEEKADSAE